jgi:hypothetical protein
MTDKAINGRAENEDLACALPQGRVGIDGYRIHLDRRRHRHCHPDAVNALGGSLAGLFETIEGKIGAGAGGG